MGNSLVPWTYVGVVWPVDKERKFKNPLGISLKEAFRVHFLLYLSQIYIIDDR